MITGKQRAFLKGLAQTKNPTIQFGKQGITDAFIKQLEINLECEELVKIAILNNSDENPKDLFAELSNEIEDLEFIQALGSKLTIYKKSKKNPKISF